MHYIYNCRLVTLLSERLADSLRLLQVIPSIQAQVFLCFRVLLLRVSPQHATSLWPVIVSELVQVFLYIEQELNADSEEFRYAISSALIFGLLLSNVEQTRSLVERYCFHMCMIYVYSYIHTYVHTRLVFLFQIPRSYTFFFQSFILFYILVFIKK